MEITDIQRYLSRKESTILEFKKSEKALPTNVFDTVCAFLNINRVEFKNANNPKDYKKLFVGNFEPYQKNPNIARFFRAIGRGEEIGSGVVNVSKYLKHYEENASVEFSEDTVFCVKMNITASRKITETKSKNINKIKLSELFYKLIEIKSQNKDINLNDILIQFNENNDTVRSETVTIENQNVTVNDETVTVNDETVTVNDEAVSIKISLTKKRKERLFKIFLLFLNNNKLIINDLVKDIKTTERTIKRDVKTLKDFDLIYYEGSDKYGNYQINNKLRDYIKNNSIKYNDKKSG